MLYLHLLSSHMKVMTTMFYSKFLTLHIHPTIHHLGQNRHIRWQSVSGFAEREVKQHTTFHQEKPHLVCLVPKLHLIKKQREITQKMMRVGK